MLRCSIIIFLFGALCGFGQKKTDTLRLYYEINETASQLNFSRIDSSLKALNGKMVDIAIYGYADYLSSDEYNQKLSLSRAEKVKQYLLNKAPASQINIYACEGKGEKNSNESSSNEGQASQRRVDVYFEPVVVFNVSDSKLETPVLKDTIKQTSVKKNIEQLKAGESVDLEGLSFEPGKHLILKESVPVLQKLLQTLKDNPNLKIEIQGHVCCTVNGADGMDLDTREMKLSENRAKAIYDYLVNKGIDSGRLTYKGFGRTRPRVDIETTAAEEQANRRVEILILEK